MRLIAIILLSITALGQTYYQVPILNTIAVTGEASTYVSSNLYTIGFTVQTIHLNATTSLSENKRISSSIDAVFNQFNVPSANITTTDFSIQPKYDNIKRLGVLKEIFQGYTVNNQIEVRLGDLNVLTKLLDRITKAGVNKVDYINLGIDEQTEQAARKRLLNSALNDARDKADLIANNTKVNIVGLHKVTYQVKEDVYPVREHGYGRQEAKASDSVKIYSDAGKKVNVLVDVTYRVKNK
jgi:uncharacterized protein YggE